MMFLNLEEDFFCIILVSIIGSNVGHVYFLCSPFMSRVMDLPVDI